MKHDLTRYAGFPLYFDPDTLAVTAGDGITFELTERKVGELHKVLLTPDGAPGDTVLYYNYYLSNIPAGVQGTLDRLDLTYSLVMVPPSRVGREFAKTAGHYHPPMQGTNISFPEVYTQLYGRLLLFMQHLDPDDSTVPDDCVLVEMTPGYVINIPPGYAHVLINHTGEPALMAGLYGNSKMFKPDYSPVQAQRGLAYYILGNGADLEAQPNPNYVAAPPLRRLDTLPGTQFEPVDAALPLWSSFLAEPDAYAFLTRPEAVVRRYALAGQYEGST